MYYGEYRFLGGMVQDDFCFSNFEGGNVCTYDYPFFLASEQVGGAED